MPTYAPTLAVNTSHVPTHTPTAKPSDDESNGHAGSGGLGGNDFVKIITGGRRSGSGKSILGGLGGSGGLNGGGGGAGGGDQDDTESPSAVPTYAPTLAVNTSHVPTHTPTAKPSEHESAKNELEKKIINKVMQPGKEQRPTISKVNKEKSETATLEVSMYSSDGQGWFQADYMGSSYYISDESRTELIAYGSIANGTYEGICLYCFDEGSYYFRVTPNNRSLNVRWSFCNTNGTSDQELAFHIKNSVCIPDVLRTVEMICDETVSAVVTLQGKLVFEGITGEDLTSKDVHVITKTLADNVPGWDTTNIELLTARPNTHNIVTLKTDRLLSPFTQDILFEVSFVPEIVYHYTDLSFNGLNSLVVELRNILENVIITHEFLEDLIENAKFLEDSRLKDVRGVQLISLSTSDISYPGSLPITLYADNSMDATNEYDHLKNTLHTEQYHSWGMFSSVKEIIAHTFAVGVVVASIVVGVAVVIISRQTRPPDAFTPEEMDMSAFDSRSRFRSDLRAAIGTGL